MSSNLLKIFTMNSILKFLIVLIFIIKLSDAKLSEDNIKFQDTNKLNHTHNSRHHHLHHHLQHNHHTKILHHHKNRTFQYRHHQHIRHPNSTKINQNQTVDHHNHNKFVVKSPQTPIANTTNLRLSLVTSNRRGYDNNDRRNYGADRTNNHRGWTDFDPVTVKKNGQSESENDFDEWGLNSEPTTQRIATNHHNYKPTKPVGGEKRICAHHRTVLVPYRTQEVYHKPAFRQFSEQCHGHQTCTGVRMVNEPTYRTVIKHRPVKQVIYSCCSGWEKESQESTGCDKPICTTPCKNGGICSKPDTCECQPGYEGRNCENDINECKVNKPCDQYCYNTEGSYYCTCREGFSLHTDRQSCKKIGGFNHGQDAFETRDLETNDLDYEEINSRLDKLEMLIKMDKKLLTNEVDKKINNAMDTINSILVRVDSIEHQQHEFLQIKDKLKGYDLQAKRIDQMVNYLYKCKTGVYPNCP